MTLPFKSPQELAEVMETFQKLAPVLDVIGAILEAVELPPIRVVKDLPVTSPTADGKGKETMHYIAILIEPRKKPKEATE